MSSVSSAVEDNLGSLSALYHNKLWMAAWIKRGSGLLQVAWQKISATPGPHRRCEQLVCVVDHLAFHFSTHFNRLEQPH